MNDEQTSKTGGVAVNHDVFKAEVLEDGGIESDRPNVVPPDGGVNLI